MPARIFIISKESKVYTTRTSNISPRNAISEYYIPVNVTPIGHVTQRILTVVYMTIQGTLTIAILSYIILPLELVEIGKD